MPRRTPILDENITHAVPVYAGDTTTTSLAESDESLIQRALSPNILPSLIKAVLSTRKDEKEICSLIGNNPQIFVDVMDRALGLDIPEFDLRTRKKFLKALYKKCGCHSILPKTMHIPVCYNRMTFPLFKGGFGDVWKGEYSNREVAVKVLRVHSDSDLQKIIGRFCKEVVMWKTLRHPNVVPLIGVTMLPDQNHCAMISEWMVGGDIKKFLKTNPDADRLKLLVDVTKGLIYIHSQRMVHGDLKGVNILIDQTGCARLVDFGLLTIMSDPLYQLSSGSQQPGGTIRWMSPELFEPQEFGFKTSRRTIRSDCYALGMVVYEVISGLLPFHAHSDYTVVRKVMEGIRPPRDAEFADILWEMLQLCWVAQPSGRPKIEEVLQCLERVLELPKPPPHLVDETTTTEEDADDRDSTTESSVTSPSVEGDLHRLESSHSSDLCDPQAAVDPMEDIIPEISPPPKLHYAATARPRKCSNCGQVGHTRRHRNCPNNSLLTNIARHSVLFRVEPTPGLSTSHQNVHYSRMRLYRKTR